MMPSEEGREVLRLLAEKKITPEQAYKLLSALGDAPGEAPRREPPPPRAPSGGAPRLLRIRVKEGGRQKVDIAVPLALARLGRVGGLAENLMRRFDIDMSDIVRHAASSMGGKIVDVVDEEGGDRVEIFVE